MNFLARRTKTKVAEPITPPADPLMQYTLEQLFDEATTYGLTRMMRHDDRLWSCSIKFLTLAQIDLEAKSGFNCKGPAEALRRAIRNAMQIKAQFKE